VTASVTAVEREGQLAMLDLGESSGIRRGWRFSVHRGGEFVAELEVVEVFPEMSAAVAVKRAPAFAVVEGDRAEHLYAPPPEKSFEGLDDGELYRRLAAEGERAERHGRFAEAEGFYARALDVVRRAEHLDATPNLNRQVLIESIARCGRRLEPPGEAGGQPGREGAAAAPGLPAIALATAGEGKVLAIESEGSLVMADLGEEQGLIWGDELAVWSGGDCRALVKVEKVYERMSAARVVEAFSAIAPGEGDRVTRLPRGFAEGIASKVREIREAEAKAAWAEVVAAGDAAAKAAHYGEALLHYARALRAVGRPWGPFTEEDIRAVTDKVAALRLVRKAPAAEEPPRPAGAGQEAP